MPNLSQLTPTEASNTVEFEIALKEKVDGVINIFFSRHMGGYRGLSAFPTHLTEYGKDWIFLQIPSYDGEIAAHELGHFFNLYHTFQAPNEFIDVIEDENVTRPIDGSNTCPPGEDCNCGINVGDELCDTPADPYTGYIEFGRCTNASCEFDGTLANCTVMTDVNDMQYAPDPKNIMSYSNCRSKFSEQQKERMLESLANDRAYLKVYDGNCDDCPLYRDINNTEHESGSVEEVVASSHITSTVLIEPETATEAGANIIYNAGNYINLYPGFEADYTSTFCALIDGCTPTQALKTISTTLLEQSSIFNNIKIVPNPFSDYTNIEFDLENDSNVSVVLSDMMGNQVSAVVDGKQFQAGRYHIPVNGTNLSAGIYYCTIQAGNHIETQKMVLTK